MKFNITVDLDDFWMDEDSLSFNDGLKNHITNQVKREIWNSISAKVEDQISRDVKKQVENQYIKTIQKVIQDVIDTGKIKGDYSNTEVTINEYIREKFVRNSGWNSPNEKIEQLAKGFADEMKKRYDLMFASQIVSKLGANGMLKEDIAKLLLDDKK